MSSHKQLGSSLQNHGAKDRNQARHFLQNVGKRAIVQRHDISDLQKDTLISTQHQQTHLLQIFPFQCVPLAAIYRTRHFGPTVFHTLTHQAKCEQNQHLSGNKLRVLICQRILSVVQSEKAQYP